MWGDNVECEQCGSTNVIPNPGLKYIMIASLFIALIPIAGWIIAPLMWIVVLAAVIIKKYKRIDLYKCKDCKNQMQIPKSS